MKVIYFLTRNLYPYLLPAIMSLLDHNEVDAVYILAEDDAIPYELPQQCRVINVSGQRYFMPGSPNWNNWFTWIVNMRVCLPKLLPDLDRIIVLDVDTIVCDDLSPIWEAEMGDNLVQLADETRGTYKPFGPHYYNTGVLVADLNKIRNEGVDDQMIQLLNQRHFLYADQDAWNIACKGRIMDLPQRYNECFATGQTDNPAIVHYAGIREHWRPNTPRHEYYDKYRKYERH